MTYINVHDAKTNLSKLLQAIESGAETGITIARNGKPVAMLVPVPTRKPIRLGLAKGMFVVPDDIDVHNDEIERMFYGED